MTHRLTTNCAKNYCNRTLNVKVIVENVVRCFLGHSVHAMRVDTERLANILSWNNEAKRLLRCHL